MSKKILECPICGGQKIGIHEKMSYHQYYAVYDNKLYNKSRTISIPFGEIWLHCEDCSQNEETEDKASWKASDQQEKLIREILIEPMSVDVTEQMNKEHDEA